MKNSDHVYKLKSNYVERRIDPATRDCLYSNTYIYLHSESILFDVHQLFGDHGHKIEGLVDK